MTFLNQKGHSVQRTIDISKQPPNHIINTKLILEQDFTLLAKFPLVSFHADTLPVLRVAIVIFSTKHLLGKQDNIGGGNGHNEHLLGPTILDNCDIF